ncbi:MAG: serine hydrolase [Blautia sp.]|nr:serine hydrolase [Blautia sp.]
MMEMSGMRNTALDRHRCLKLHLHIILFLVCLFFGPTWTVPASEPAGMTALHDALRTYLDELPGSWSVYVKNLNTDELFSLNNDRSFSAASLIKPFAMEVVCTHREEVLSRMAAREWLEPDDPALAGELEMLLENMITYSDNDAFNELVCLLSDTGDFMDGAGVMNDELQKLGYKSTSVDHTLAPSYFEPEGTGDNMTCASDCGWLLEKVCGGTFVDEQVSEEMMELLRMQDTRTKIPAGLPAYAQCANKTGETSTVQHDMAVIRGRTAWYVLCVLSGDCPEEEAVDQIREIAGLTFTYLDTDEYTRGS